MDILSHKLRVTLDNRLKDGRLIKPPSPTALQDMVDFGTNDTLSLSTSGALREEFSSHISEHRDYSIGSLSSRIFEGQRKYLRDLEDDLANFHGAEAAIFFNSGYDANVATWSTLPQPGDFILYDEYVHASIHDGMRRSRAETIKFLHNDLSSMSDCLRNILKSNNQMSKGESVIFIVLESFYSMDGDAAPIEELFDLAQKSLPLSNFVFSIDEAHSSGLVGPKGKGFISHYGMEREFPIRLHTCGKALGSSGAVLLCNNVIKQTIINYSRGVIFSTAPSFVIAVAVRSGYKLLASAEGKKRREVLQQNIYSFYQKLKGHPTWLDAKTNGVLKLPAESLLDTEPFLSPIVPLVTLPGEAVCLKKYLEQGYYWVNAVHYPIVPKNMDRIRIVLHTHNTEAQIEGIVERIMTWASDHFDHR